MKRTLKYLVLFVVVFSVAFIGCKKKVQPGLSEINKECDCAEEVSADFTIEELAFNTSPNFLQYRTETDTIWQNKNVRFYAKQQAESYKWIIGNDTIENRLVYRNFNSSWGGQMITVKLILYKKPNRICFPNEKGHDTVVKSFFVAAYPTGASWCLIKQKFEGKFKVLRFGQTDSVIIQSRICDTVAPFDPVYNWYISNPDRPLNPLDKFGYPEYGNYDQWWFYGQTGGTSVPTTYISVQNKAGMITIQYPKQNYSPEINYLYKGRKL